MLRPRRGSTALAALLASAILVNAQAITGMLIGSVYDETGRPLAGAKVTAINELNGHSRSTLTEQDGSYRIPALPPGRYTIRASLAGFADGMHLNFPVPLGAKRTFVPPITLTNAATAAATPAVPLDGDARSSLVTTGDPTRRANFTLQQLSVLPLGATTETRSFDEAALLASGVAPAPYTPGVRGPGVGFGLGTSGQFSVNGMRGRSNNFTVDGSDNNDPDVGVRRQGFVALVPQSIESVQEFQLSTLLWDAEAGRNVGSQVNAVSKSGGSSGYHGIVYGFFTDSALNARNAFDFTGGASGGEDPYTRAMVGFVLGGPLYKDKTQFFTSYERQEINASVEQHFSVPTAGQRRFLGLPEFAVIRPFPGADADLGFRTMAGATPIGTNVLSLYPLPNNPQGPYGLNNYTETLPASGNGNVFSFKVTHRFDDDNTLAVRYNFTDDDRLLPAVSRAIHSTIGSNTTTNNVSVIFDTALSATLFNQARFSYGRTELSFPEQPGSPFLFDASSVVGIDTPGGTLNFTSSTFPIGQLHIEPFSPVGVDVFTFPQGRTNNTYQFADSVSWTRGAHSVKFGADIRYNQLNSFQDRNYRPLVQFGNGLQAFGFLNETGNPLTPFGFTALSTVVPLPGVQLAAFGAPSSLFQVITQNAPDSSIKLRFTEYNFFVNDSWRVRPNFVLDYGVRYEYNSVPTEADSKIENDLQLQGIPPSDGSIVDGPVRQASFDLVTRSLNNILQGREKIYDNDPNNFGPHVGFAWDPWSDGRTSIRGGYGVYFDTILGALVSQSRNQFPSEIPINVTPDFLGTDILNLPNPAVLAIRDARGNIIRSLIKPGTVNQFGGNPEDFIPLIGQLAFQNFNSGGVSITLPVKDIATPYTQQWHLTVEKQLWTDYAFSVAYVGTKGTKLTRLTTPNLGPNVTPFLPVAVAAPGTPYQQGPPLVVADFVQSIIRPRPDPFLGAVQRFENSANSIYHALQVEARKRYSHGYTFTFAYTWSHAIDDVSDVFPIAGAPVLPEDTFNLALERGDANYDVRHRFAASAIWDLPFYRDATSPDVGSAAWFLGGWQISSVAQGYTGQPFTLNVPFDANLDGNLTDRPLSTEGLTFIDEHGPRRVAIEDNPIIANYVFFPYVSFSPEGIITIAGQNGAVGRNTVRADGIVDWDVAFNKRFHFTETQNLEFRTEIFNVLNRTNYGIPIRTLFNPGFGESVETALPARIIQFALKYSF
jgi:hypothetical protein